MKRNKDRYAVTRMTALLGISRSAYYHWEKYGLSARQERQDAELEATLRRIHTEHPYYGAPRILVELRETYHLKINGKRVARDKRETGREAAEKVWTECEEETEIREHHG